MARRGCARVTCAAICCRWRRSASRGPTSAAAAPGGDDDLAYNPAQRLAYFTVVAVLFPAMIWTGLAMSPAVTAVVPFLVTVLGGQQSARTIHFAVACALVLFLAGHVAMVALSGFRVRMRGMITGRRAMSAGRA